MEITLGCGLWRLEKCCEVKWQREENELCPTCCCSVTKSCPTLCNPMDCNMPGFPVLQQLPELAQIYVYWEGDAIKPSHPLPPPSSFDFSLSQHQGLFHCLLFPSGGQSIGTSASAWVPLMNIQGWFPLGLTGFISLLSKGLSRAFSSTQVWKHQFFITQPSLWSRSHGSSVHEILQARILEWVAIPFSRVSNWPRDSVGLPQCRHILYLLSHQRIPLYTLMYVS